jgi:hypothetical protein
MRPTAPSGRPCVALTGAGNPCPRRVASGDLCSTHRGAQAARGRCVAVYELTGGRCRRPVSGARRAYGCLCLEHAGLVVVVWGVCDRPWEVREALAHAQWEHVGQIPKELR